MENENKYIEIFYDVCFNHNKVFHENSGKWIELNVDISIFRVGENIIPKLKKIFYINEVECNKCNPFGKFKRKPWDA